jgi:hypothetical protein
MNVNSSNIKRYKIDIDKLITDKKLNYYDISKYIKPFKWKTGYIQDGYLFIYPWLCIPKGYYERYYTKKELKQLVDGTDF